jgi:hypothetical protein
VKNDVTITRVEDTVLEKRKEKGGKESKRWDVKRFCKKRQNTYKFFLHFNDIHLLDSVDLDT